VGLRLAAGLQQHWAPLLLAGMLVAGLLLVPLTSSVPVRFATAWEFKDFATKHGLYCHSGNANAVSVCGNLFIADHPMTLEHTSALTKRDCGLTPAWRGIAWVQQIDMGHSIFEPDCVLGSKRIWGNVLVAGDEDFINRIEERFRASCP
jgi:hypothetical protein